MKSNNESIYLTLSVFTTLYYGLTFIVHRLICSDKCDCHANNEIRNFFKLRKKRGENKKKKKDEEKGKKCVYKETDVAFLTGPDSIIEKKTNKKNTEHSIEKGPFAKTRLLNVKADSARLFN